jgi:hypothetical protein
MGKRQRSSCLTKHSTVLAVGFTMLSISHWKAVTTLNRFAGGPTKLRLEITQPNGQVRLLAPAFDTRVGLDRYVARFLPEFAGKEVST